jgi:hypothetical protein
MTPDTQATPPAEPPPSFLSRISIAIGSFFSILFDAQFAARVEGLRQARTATGAPVQPEKPSAPVAVVIPLRQATPDAALQLLALLQRDARLIDFTQENLSNYSDAEIGGAARLVHEGCAKVLREHFTLVPVRDEAEGSRLRLEEGFDARAIRLTGNVVGQAPFQGSLSHRGWRASETRLPKLTEQHDVSVLAQAEVEL